MRPEPPRIALLAPLGWCLRDWVFSDFLPRLASEAEVVLFSPQAEALREHVEQDAVTFEWMDIVQLGPLAAHLREMLKFGSYYRQPTFILEHLKRLHRHKASSGSIKTRLRFAGVHAAARYVFKNLPPRWNERMEQRFLGLMEESRRIEAVLRKHRVDLLFATTPLVGYYEYPALWAAQRLGVPVAGFITSWDNLFSKGRLPMRFGRYLVWSRQMRDDLLTLYPDVDPARVTEVGVPRFDFYRRPGLVEERATFLRAIGGDPARKLILWTGVSPNLMPQEPALLEQFCEAIRAGALEGDPQVLVRPHPIGGGAPFAELRRRYPEVLFTETNDTDPGRLVGWMPMGDDMALLVNSIAHADVNINLCSTITLDCCAMDVPVVNIMFDYEAGSMWEEFLRSFYLFEHYRTVAETGAARFASSLDELIAHTKRYLDNPALERPNRKALLELWCGDVDGKAAVRAAECLLAEVRTDTPAYAAPRVL